MRSILDANTIERDSSPRSWGDHGGTDLARLEHLGLCGPELIAEAAARLGGQQRIDGLEVHQHFPQVLSTALFPRPVRVHFQRSRVNVNLPTALQLTEHSLPMVRSTRRRVCGEGFSDRITASHNTTRLRMIGYVRDIVID